MYQDNGTLNMVHSTVPKERKKDMKKKMIIGYCRISTARQNIDRQERNILARYPDAKIYKEVYTGTKIDGRKSWNMLYKLVKSEAEKQDITIVFDSVSRMSRNADEGFELYKELYSIGVRLVFIKEPHINTDTYKEQLNKQIKLDTSTSDKAEAKLMNSIAEALNTYMMDLAEKQIKLAFEQSEKEVADLRKRTAEGLLTAKLNGKQVGRVEGRKYESKKAKTAKERIIKISKTFEGNLADAECIEMLQISRNSYYKYKAEIKAEMSC
ncbi:recombinase family protein [Fusicatenibacter sp.]